MFYDYSKLKGKITEVCGTQLIFSERMGLSERTISLKLNNKVPWTQPEMQNAANVLGIMTGELQDYFFKLQVQ